MQFRIADTFTDSLAKLTGDEQKAVKTAAFDLQMNPAHPGLKLHQVDRAQHPDGAQRACHGRSARRVQVLGGVQGG